jgi:cell division protein FtsI (penicillin-binding protein 3)
VKLPLQLVEGCTMPDGTVVDVPAASAGSRVVSEAAADSTLAMMETVNSQGALKNVLTVPGYRIANKTGTAQVADSSGYGTDRIVSVAGVFPVENPKYAIVVTFGKPDTMKTSAAAAPTFAAIAKQVIKTYRVTPSTVAAPYVPLTW